MNFGLQTFTVRKMQKKSLEAAYLPIVNMGISEFEIARIDFSEKNANAVKELSVKYGIKPVAIQVKPKCIFESADKIGRFCEITGCKNAVISMLPFDSILGGEKKFYSFISSLDKQFDIYASLGITLAYHHHNWEYIRLSNGKTRMQELLSETERIRFVHDTYWSARSGVDPARQIKEFGNRLLGIHLRDLTFKKRLLSVVPCDAPVGTGVIDFSAVLSAAGETACEYAVIEQKTDLPYESIGISYNNLLKIKNHVEEQKYEKSVD